MSKYVVEWEIEELKLQENLYVNVLVQVEMGLDPGEKGDDTTPGVKPHFYWVDWKIQIKENYDNRGTSGVAVIDTVDICEKVENWLDENNQLLHDLATRKYEGEYRC